MIEEEQCVEIQLAASTREHIISPLANQVPSIHGKVKRNRGCSFRYDHY